jgi:hypothetical protein
MRQVGGSRIEMRAEDEAMHYRGFAAAESRGGTV